MNPATELHSVKSALDTLTTKGIDDRLDAMEAKIDGAVEMIDRALAGIKGHGSARSADPLRERVQGIVNDVLTDGTSKPPTHRVAIEEQPPRPGIDPDELKRRSRDLIVQLLAG